MSAIRAGRVVNTYVSGSGADTLWVRVSEGGQWSAWSQSFTVSDPTTIGVPERLRTRHEAQATNLDGNASQRSKNSKANPIETGERSAGIGEICSVEVAMKNSEENS
jgi:hypothetical protein